MVFGLLRLVHLIAFFEVMIVQKTRQFCCTVGASFLLIARRWLLGLLLQFGVASFGCFFGRKMHGIVGGAQFEVVLQFALEEIAIAVGALFILYFWVDRGALCLIIFVLHAQFYLLSRADLPKPYHPQSKTSNKTITLTHLLWITHYLNKTFVQADNIYFKKFNQIHQYSLWLSKL